MPAKKEHSATGHVIYTCTPDIQNIFLHESSSIVYAVKKNEIETPAQSMSKDFISLLQDRGFDVIEKERRFYQGINYFCGIRIEITKMKEKGVIKQLLITVFGKNDREIVEKLDLINKNVGMLCKEKPKMESYTKITRC